MGEWISQTAAQQGSLLTGRALPLVTGCVARGGKVYESCAGSPRVSTPLPSKRSQALDSSESGVSASKVKCQLSSADKVVR